MAKKIIVITVIIFVVFCGTIAIKLFNKKALSGEKEGNMKITADFSNKEKIPAKYTCDGDDTSPELLITDVPQGAKSLVLIMDDPDAPMGTFTHWLLFNIPINTVKISSQSLPKGSLQGVNDFGRLNYGGPCPPSGVHGYHFKLYAINKFLDLKAGATKTELEKAIKNNIVEETELIGMYSRR